MANPRPPEVRNHSPISSQSGSLSSFSSGKFLVLFLIFFNNLVFVSDIFFGFFSK